MNRKGVAPKQRSRNGNENWTRSATELLEQSSTTFTKSDIFLRCRDFETLMSLMLLSFGTFLFVYSGAVSEGRTRLLLFVAFYSICDQNFLLSLERVENIFCVKFCTVSIRLLVQHKLVRCIIIICNLT